MLIDNTQDVGKLNGLQELQEIKGGRARPECPTKTRKDIFEFLVWPVHRTFAKQLHDNTLLYGNHGKSNALVIIAQLLS